MTEEEREQQADEQGSSEAGTEPAGTESGQSEKDPGQMSEEELRARLEKHFREQKVDEVLVQFLVSLSNLAYIKMGLTEESKDVRDLAQSSLAIDSFKALLDAAAKRLPEQDASALAGALSSMQMTFAKVSASAPSAAAPGQPASSDKESGKADSGEPASGESGESDTDPASRLWVPGKE